MCKGADGCAPATLWRVLLTAASYATCAALHGAHKGLTATIAVSAGGRRGLAKLPAAPAQPRAGAGPQPSRKLRAFFWDALPDARIPGTFWEAHPPPYASLDTLEVPAAALSRLQINALQGLQCTADPCQIDMSAQTVPPMPEALPWLP